MPTTPNDAPVAPPFRYRAFISYASLDRVVGERFQAALERYVIPRPLRGRMTAAGTVPKRLLPIFRDRWDLEANKDLGARIRQALEEAYALIVLCSPRAAASHWVNEEIRTFQRLGRGDKIIAVLIDGTPSEFDETTNPLGAFPPALLHPIDSSGAPNIQSTPEPFAPDLREPNSDGSGGDGFQYGKLKVAASLLDIALTELTQRHVEQERRDRRVARTLAVAGFSLAALVAAAGYFAFLQRDEALSTESKFLARQAEEVVAPLGDFEAGDPARALQLALEGAPTTRQALFPRPLVPEIESAIREAGSRLTLRRTLVHGGAIAQASFSADGKFVVTASKNGSARIWDVASGQAIGPPLRHGGSIWSANFSPDGTRVVTASEDRTARLWDVRRGTPIGPPMKHYDTVWSAVFSPDGTLVLTASRDSSARLWDARTAKLLREVAVAGEVADAVFSPDGKMFATAANRNPPHAVYPGGVPFPAPTTITVPTLGPRLGGGTSPQVLSLPPPMPEWSAQIWDVQTGDPIGAVMHHSADVVHVVFSPDGKHLLTTSSDKTARVWDVKTETAIGAPLRHDDAVIIGTFTRDGTRIATASLDKTVRLWNAVNGEPVGQPIRLDMGADSVEFSPDGSRLLTASSDLFSNNGAARIFDANTLELIQTMKHPGEFLRSEFSPDGKQIVTAAGDGAARIWDVAQTGPIAVLKHEGSMHRSGPLGFLNSAVVLNGARFSADGTRIVTAHGDGSAQLWDARTATPIGAAMRHGWYGSDNAVRSAVFSPDDRLVLTASDGGTAQLWDAHTGAPVGHPITHDGPVSMAMFTPDGSRIVTVSAATARIWNASNGERIGVAMAHSDEINDVEISGDGQRIVTASADNTARIWDTRTGKPLGTVMRHTEEVKSAAFSPDGKRVATASWDKTIRLWDGFTAQPIGAPLRHEEESVQVVKFAPDGRRLAAGYMYGSVQVWNLQTGAAIKGPKRHEKAVLSLSFSPDGTRFVTTSEDGIAQIWDAQTGVALGIAMRPVYSGFMNGAVFSSDGTRVLTSSTGGVARLWDSSQWAESGPELVAHACRALNETGVGPLPATLREKSFRPAGGGDPCDRHGLLNLRFY